MPEIGFENNLAGYAPTLHGGKGEVNKSEIKICTEGFDFAACPHDLVSVGSPCHDMEWFPACAIFYALLFFASRVPLRSLRPEE